MRVTGRDLGKPDGQMRKAEAGSRLKMEGSLKVREEPLWPRSGRKRLISGLCRGRRKSGYPLRRNFRGMWK